MANYQAGFTIQSEPGFTEDCDLNIQREENRKFLTLRTLGTSIEDFKRNLLCARSSRIKRGKNPQKQKKEGVPVLLEEGKPKIPPPLQLVSENYGKAQAIIDFIIGGFHAEWKNDRA